MYYEDWGTKYITYPVVTGLTRMYYLGVSVFMYLEDWDTKDILVYPDSCI